MAIGWRYLWPYVTNWWGWTVAIVTFASAPFLKFKNVVENWEFFLDRCFDSKVRNVLEANRKEPMTSAHGRFIRWGQTLSVAELASATKFSERRVNACLNRLSKKKQAIRQDDGRWKAPDEIT